MKSHLNELLPPWREPNNCLLAYSRHSPCFRMASQFRLVFITAIIQLYILPFQIHKKCLKKEKLFMFQDLLECIFKYVRHIFVKIKPGIGFERIALYPYRCCGWMHLSCLLYWWVLLLCSKWKQAAASSIKAKSSLSFY